MTQTVLLPLSDLFGFLGEIVGWIIGVILFVLGWKAERRADRHVEAERWGPANVEQLNAITFFISAGFLLLMIRL